MQSEDANSGQMQKQDLEQQQSKPIQFQWDSKWLKGHEYAFILKNIEAYCNKFAFVKYPHKVHPLSIYQSPQNGMIYFVQGSGVGSQFGFPRVSAKKKYRWKKMNFTTDLPKKDPEVTYVVASAVKSHKIDHLQYPIFRMHAVVLHGQQKKENSYILCHVREMHKKTEGPIQKQQEGNHANINFYQLFAYIHNYQYREQQS